MNDDNNVINDMVETQEKKIQTVKEDEESLFLELERKVNNALKETKYKVKRVIYDNTYGHTSFSRIRLIVTKKEV